MTCVVWMHEPEMPLFLLFAEIPIAGIKLTKNFRLFVSQRVASLMNASLASLLIRSAFMHHADPFGGVSTPQGRHGAWMLSWRVDSPRLHSCIMTTKGISTWKHYAALKGMNQYWIKSLHLGQCNKQISYTLLTWSVDTSPTQIMLVLQGRCNPFELFYKNKINMLD